MGIAIGIIILFAIVMSIVLWITQNKELAVCIILGLLTIACIYIVMIWFPRFQCEEKVRMSGNECHWELFTGCQVKVNGQWIPYEKWRSFE